MDYLVVLTLIHVFFDFTGLAVTFDNCEILGAPVITVGGPLSISEGFFFSYGEYMLNASLLFQQWVNFDRNPRGIWIDNIAYCLCLNFEDDLSSTESVQRIAINMTQTGAVDFFLSPVSNTLTHTMIDITDEAGYIVFASGASSVSIFSSHQFAFSLLPSAEHLYESLITLLVEEGAKNISYLHEDSDFMNESCKAIDTIVSNMGGSVTLLDAISIPLYSSYDVVESAVDNMNSDIVVVCATEQTCQTVTEAMKNKGLEPKALVMSHCLSVPSYVDAVGEDSTHLLSNSIWSEKQNLMDEVTGWSTAEFVSRYTSMFHKTPSSASASQFAALEVLITAIEAADSLQTENVAFEIARLEIDTILGVAQFDNNNMNDIESIVIQMDDDLTLQIVIPEDPATYNLTYPMESWSKRACLDDGYNNCECGYCRQCQENDAIYDYSASCEGTKQYATFDHWNRNCSPGTPADPTRSVACVYIPMDSSLGISLIVFACTVALVGALCGGWIFVNRSKPIIRSSQPTFLMIICFGYIILSLNTLTFIGEPNVSMCITRFCVISFGFTLMFGTLLIMVYRVWKIFANKNLSKIVVRERDAFVALAAMIAIDIIFMILWLTAMKPTLDKEEHKKINESCEAEEGYFGVIALYKMLQLLAGCALSHETRHVDEVFMQSKLIGIAVFIISTLWFIFMIFVMFATRNEVTSSILCIVTLLASCIIGMAFIVVPKIRMQMVSVAASAKLSIRNPRQRLTMLKKQISVRLGLKEEEMDLKENYGLYRLSSMSICSIKKEECIRLLTRTLEMRLVLQNMNEKLDDLKERNRCLMQDVDIRNPILTKPKSDFEFGHFMENKL